MGRIKDIAGLVFGKLSVVSYDKQNKHGASLWLCRCECGVEKVVSSNDLKTGNTVSCGCHRSQALASGRAALHKASKTHGKSKTREHHTWQNMIYRCHTESCPGFFRYGGKGIAVCQRWRDSFEAFLEDMGPRPHGSYSVDRIDGNGNYEPGNCRWATKQEQAINRKSTVMLEHNGETRTLTEWAKIVGLPKGTVSRRILKGLTAAQALDTSHPQSKRKIVKPLESDDNPIVFDKSFVVADGHADVSTLLQRCFDSGMALPTSEDD